MTTLYVTEYKQMGHAQGNLAQLPQEPAVAEQAVTFTTTTASSAFNAETTYVCLRSSGDCHVVFDDAPTATTGSRKLSANTEYYFGVRRGDKVAAVDAA